MKVLVIGEGGREHALVWKIAQSPLVREIFCAPGNAGTSSLSTSVDISIDNIQELASFAKKNAIDLTVVGPELPLVRGIVDVFQEAKLAVFGPSRAAARLEGSKFFAKQHMEKYHIPCARGKAFTDASKAKIYAKAIGTPCVVKADGLAAGKGVIICDTLKKTNDAIDSIMTDKTFGQAGQMIVIEECLKGEEASFIVITDGKTVLPLPESQDHKRIFDNDKGPNTGGMGAYSPAPIMDHMLKQKAMNQVMLPAIKGMEDQGIPFKGILYAGLMIEKDQIKVLEFNVRLGDPETQAILMRVENDIVPLMEACCNQTLHQHATKISPKSAVCVVMSSGGYPGEYQSGHEIEGINKASKVDSTQVFQAGTTIKDEKIITKGGRVLGVTSMGDTVEKAIENAYKACSNISFKDQFLRKDIGAKAVKRLSVIPQVGIVMGSDSDFPIMEPAIAFLRRMDIPYYVTVCSAHRTPERAREIASKAQEQGVKVLICGAGHAAHLAGVMAAHTILPVIGVPIDSSALKGMDSLLATVQMPPGIPVSTMAIGKSGATNAAITAAQILALSNVNLGKKLFKFKEDMAEKVNQKAASFA